MAKKSFFALEKSPKIAFLVVLNFFALLKLHFFLILEHCVRYKFEPMLEQFAFVPGEGGGIKAIGKAFKKAEEQSFYVADDEKAIILVDLLQVDKNLEVEVFLSLLSDLSCLIKEEHEMNTSLDLTKAKSSHEEELLQLERDLDRTMNGLRRRLMIIRMIGLMGEDDR